MKGRNTLSLNHATMVEALQLWVNQQFAGNKPKVASVRKSDKSADWFSVDLEGDDVANSQGEVVKANIARADGT